LRERLGFELARKSNPSVGQLNLALLAPTRMAKGASGFAESKAVRQVKNAIFEGRGG
jgi:hypothetical protein